MAVIEKEPLSNQIDRLNEKINKIIKQSDSSQTKAIVSDKIMELLRDEHIYIPKKYADPTNPKYKFFSKVTIHPADVKTDDELIKENKEEYFKVKAYSFGPFNPDVYFKKDIRIVYLLREPYCENIDEIKLNNKIYNQANDYKTWENVRKNTTIRNVIKICGAILRELGLNVSNDEEEAFYTISQHLCILEVNHFPGLAFSNTKSNEKYFPIWGKLNLSTLSKMINFYEPTLVIGDFCSLSCITDYNKEAYNWKEDWSRVHFFTWLNNYWNRYKKEYPELEVTICNNSCTIYLPPCTSKETAVQDDKGIIWIARYHPAYLDNSTLPDFSKWVADMIRNYKRDSSQLGA